jgi:Uncharacterized protein conserved in bacteria
MAVNPIPEGYRTITPYLINEGPAKILEFLEKAFGAKVTFKMEDDKGDIRHAEVKVGDSMVMVGGAGSQWPAMPCSIYVYVPDVDATYKTAMEAGAVSLNEPVTQFYGDRVAGVKDPGGNMWWIGTHVEDVSPEEMGRRAAAAPKR